jgi:hypothetical protein
MVALSYLANQASQYDLFAQTIKRGNPLLEKTRHLKGAKFL